jgi:hypothetical protein
MDRYLFNKKQRLKLSYDRRPVGLFVCCLTIAGFLLWGALYDERTSMYGKLVVESLLGFARAVTFGSKSRRTHDHSVLSHSRLPSTWVPFT